MLQPSSESHSRPRVRRFWVVAYALVATGAIALISLDLLIAEVSDWRTWLTFTLGAILFGVVIWRDSRTPRGR